MASGERKLGSIKRHPKSWTQFCQEHSRYDTEAGTYVRFLGPFEMPSFEDVVNNEVEFMVDSPWVRLSNIAKRVYGDERLWWVIAARNNIDLPDAELYEGMKLKVPTNSYVMKHFVNRSSGTVEE